MHAASPRHSSVRVDGEPATATNALLDNDAIAAKHRLLAAPGKMLRNELTICRG